MINEKTQKKQVSKVTADMLTGLSENICAMFIILYPDGLDVDALTELADDSNFHRIVLQHVQKGGM